MVFFCSLEFNQDSTMKMDYQYLRLQHIDIQKESPFNLEIEPRDDSEYYLS